MQQIILSIVIFLAITLILVSVLLYVRKKLVPEGDVKININGEKELTVKTGSSLLSTLAEQKIYLPSACGGKGSCGMCKCQVLEGGGDILPTEKSHFSRKQMEDHYRLGCQVKVKNDLKIQIPESIFGIKKWECTVVSNRNVGTFIKEFVVKLPEGEQLHFRSGGYIQIDVPACTVNYRTDIEVDERYHADWNHFKVWDLVMKNPEPCFRAYSMANHPAENNIIMLNIRLATPPLDRVHGGWMKFNPGVCSSYIWSLKPGDKVTISGPYGEFFIKDTDKEMMFIGGGVGMAPMRSHIFDLFKTKHTKRRVSFWYGARAVKDLFYVEDFKEIEAQNPNFSYHVALSAPDKDDNWNGYTGFISDVIYQNYLKDHKEPEEIEYYLCGPPAMVAATLKMLDSLGVPSENIMYDNFGS